jgi:hypothetical protein
MKNSAVEKGTGAYTILAGSIPQRYIILPDAWQGQMGKWHVFIKQEQKDNFT